MEKDIVLYPEALILRGLGFKENCFGFFNINGEFVADYNISMDANKKLVFKGTCLAPTYAQVFRWFRDVHHIDGWVVPYHSLNGKKYCIQCELTARFPEDDDTDFELHEEAELHLLQLLIKIVQKQNHESEHEI